MNLGARRMTAVGSEDEAFEALFTAEYGRVVAIANRVLADPHEAEDVAQEVFIDFHRKHPPQAPYAAPWLRAAAAHTALNRIRSRKRREQREVRHATDAGNQPEALDPETGAGWGAGPCQAAGDPRQATNAGGADRGRAGRRFRLGRDLAGLDPGHAAGHVCEAGDRDADRHAGPAGSAGPAQPQLLRHDQ